VIEDLVLGWRVAGTGAWLAWAGAAGRGTGDGAGLALSW